MSDSTGESNNEIKERNKPTSNSPSTRSLNNDIDTRDNRKNSLNRSHEQQSKVYSRQNSRNSESNGRLGRRNLRLMTLISVITSGVCICMSIASLCLYFTFSPSQTSATSYDEHITGSGVFKLDPTRINAPLHYNDTRYRMPFVNQNCKFLSFDTTKRIFTAKLSGTFQLTLSIGFKFNNSVGRNTRLCLYYITTKEEACIRVKFQSDTHITLALPDIVSLKKDESFYVKLPVGKNLIADDSLSRLIVQYRNR